MLNNLQQMRLKLLQKEKFKKQRKQLAIRLVIKQQNNSEAVANDNYKEIPKDQEIQEKDRKLLMK